MPGKVEFLVWQEGFQVGGAGMSFAHVIWCEVLVEESFQAGGMISVAFRGFIVYRLIVEGFFVSRNECDYAA